ncbi:MAG: hypothetical protein ACYCO9_16365 [Streptosporangiaceae bacterium]
MPSPRRPVPPDYLDETHQRISEFASWLWDADDDEAAEVRDSFIADAMIHKRYEPKTHTSWEPPAPSDLKPPAKRQRAGYFAPRQ